MEDGPMEHYYEVFLELAGGGTMTTAYFTSYKPARALANRIIEGKVTEGDRDNCDGGLDPDEHDNVRVVCVNSNGQDYPDCRKNCGANKDKAFYKERPALKKRHQSILKARRKDNERKGQSV